MTKVMIDDRVGLGCNFPINMIHTGEDADRLVSLLPEHYFGFRSRQGYLGILKADYIKEGIDWETSREGIARLYLTNPDHVSSWNMVSAQRAFEQYEESVQALLAGSKMNIVLSFLGDSFPSGVVSGVIRASRSEGAVTVAMVSFPHPDEGNKHQHQSRHALQEIRAVADSVCLVPLEQVYAYFAGRKLPFDQLNEAARVMFSRCIRGIADLAGGSGFRSPHFGDVIGFFRDAGEVLVGYGEIGDEPAGGLQAIRTAMENPLHPRRRFEAAEQIIVSVCLGEPAMPADEYRKIGKFCREFVGSNTDVIVGNFKARKPGESPWLVVFGRQVLESRNDGFDYPVTDPPPEKAPPELPSYYKRFFGRNRNRKVGGYDF